MGRTAPKYVHEHRQDLSFEWTIAVRYFAAGEPVLAIPDGADITATTGFDREIASFVPNVPGIYAFDLSVTDNFDATISDRVTITVLDCGTAEEPVEEGFALDSFLVYPNPFSDNVRFAFDGQGEPEGMRVVVYDLPGRQLWEEEVQGNIEIVWDGTTSDGDRLANGPYAYSFFVMGAGAPYIDTGIVFLKR